MVGLFDRFKGEGESEGGEIVEDKPSYNEYSSSEENSSSVEQSPEQEPESIWLQKKDFNLSKNSKNSNPW